jgi:hypothetical protein
MGTLLTCQYLRNFSLAALLLLACYPYADIQAQPSAFGALEDSLAYEALPIMPLFDTGQKGADDLPSAVSLRPFCPRPLNQASTGACSGFAAGYGAMTIISGLKSGDGAPRDPNRLACSPWFIYNQIKEKPGDCGSRSSMENAIQVLKTQGICLLQDFNPDPVGCDELPSETIKREAASRKLKDVARLFPEHANTAQKITALRNALGGKLPVVALMQVYESFTKLGQGTKFWRGIAHLDSYIDKHFVVVTGYNDRDQTFEIMSSWGDSWADAGFAYVDYQAFAAVCLKSYQFLPFDYWMAPLPAEAQHPLAAHNTPKNNTLDLATMPTRETQATNPSLQNPETMRFLEGKFEFAQPVWSEEHQMYIPVPEQVIYDESAKIYRLVKGIFPINTQFWLQSSAIPVGKYVYVFSCDAAGKVQLHWPKDDRQAQYVPNPHIIITIPDRANTLTLTQPGDDFLCVLYSDDPITDVSDRLARIRGYSVKNMLTQLQHSFGSLLISSDKIKYEPDTMQAKCHAKLADGVAMLMILKVTGR